MCIGQKLAKLNIVNFSKNIFLTLNFFMQIFNISVTYMQSIKKIH